MLLILSTVYDNISSVIKDKTAIRKNINEQFSVIFKGVHQLADRIDTQPSVPRTASKKINRDNIETDFPEVYYKRVFTVPFIDTLISYIELRFDKLSHSASRLSFLVPNIIVKTP